MKVLPFSPNPDCSLAPADTAHVFSTGEVPPSTNTTVAVLGLNGNASTPFGVEAFPNEDDSGTADNPGVRFINVVAGETHVAKLSIPDPVAFILMSQFTNVSFGQTDLSLAANAGYKVVAVPHGSYFGLDDDADPSADYISATLPQAVTPAPNQTYTIWATGNKGDTSNPPVVLFCQDSETQTSSFLSCSTVTLNPQ